MSPLQSSDSVLVAEQLPDSISPYANENRNPAYHHLEWTSAFAEDPSGFAPDPETGSEFPSLQHATPKNELQSDLPQSQPWLEDRVLKGDTFVKISLRNGLSYQQALNIANATGAETLHNIKPGKIIRFQLGPEQRLDAVQYALHPLETLEIRRNPETGDYVATTLSHTPDVRIRKFSGSIETSVFKTAQTSDIPYSIIEDLIFVYQWKIDFFRDIFPDDKFSIIFEELFIDDKRIGTGKLLSAELDLSGNKLQAIRYTDPEGHTDYYSPNGESLRRGFLRSPVKFANISSHFSPKRLHPVTKQWKPHRGVDYSAPTGTPVMSTGDGKIVKAGNMNGYGITVVIKHNMKYKSLYAHLSKIAKGIKPGKKVQQGQVIGYVGNTGMSTGPHLHYEFQVDGVHQNAVTVKLPSASQVHEKFMPEFNSVVTSTLQQLSALNPLQLAHSQSAPNSSGG